MILRNTNYFFYSSKDATQITIHPFDARHDSSALGILLPSQTLHLLSLTRQHSSLASRHAGTCAARAAAALVVVRAGIKDLAIITPDGSLKILLWGIRELDVTLSPPTTNLHSSDPHSHSRSGSLTSMYIASPSPPPQTSTRNTIVSAPFSHRPVALVDPVGSSVTIEFDDGGRSRASLDFTPQDWVVTLGFEALARAVPAEEGWGVRKRWLQARWTGSGVSENRTEFECFADAVCDEFLGPREGANRGPVNEGSAWESLAGSRTHVRIRDEQMFTAVGLALPEPGSPPHLRSSSVGSVPTSPHLAPAMLALHLAAQTLVADVTKMDRLADMGRLVLRLARRVRADYVDYWSRICCDSEDAWRECAGNGEGTLTRYNHLLILLSFPFVRITLA